MATQVYFGGKLRKLPGAYSRITSGEQNSSLNLDYGKILVIDTGLGAGFGGGAGIDGTIESGKDSIYRFTDVESYKSFLKGGLLWKAAEKLFFPYAGANGISEVLHVRAATTVPASMTFSPVGGASNGGTFKINCKDEGVVGNGVLTSTHLDKGYAFTVVPGVVDPNKFIFKIWLGQWKGDYTDGLSYDTVIKADAVAVLVASSPEFDNVQTLLDWANQDKTFGNYFVLDGTSAVAGDGSVDSGDVEASYVVASGGTEAYLSTLTSVFEAITDIDYQFILCDKYGTDDYDDSIVTEIVNHIKDAGTDFIKTMFIGAGADEDEFATVDGSLAIAAHFNTNRVVAVHGNIKETTDLLAGGFRIWPSLIHAATVLGRVCGLAPQIPITNKLIGVDGLVHNIKVKDQERALDAGLLVTIQDYARGGFKVLQGVNTLQDNKSLFNALGYSHSIQFERIVAQINRELIVNSQTDLLNNEEGVNVNTLSPGILKTWTETYLQGRVALPDADNLLISFRNVTVTRIDDYYNVTYGIVVNNEITKIFYTGYLFKS